MNKIKVAVIGVGVFGGHHARVYSAMEGVLLAGVADANAARAKEIAEKYQTKAFADYRDLIGKIDAVSIATPTVTHAEIAEKFLKNGAHALVEKPIAGTLEDAERIINCAEKNGKILAVGHLERFNPVVEWALENVKNPRFIEIHRIGSFSPRSIDIDVLLDLMVHDIDIALTMVRAPVKAVRAVGVCALTDKLDIANARLEFEGGCVANLTASRISADRIRKLRVFEPDRYITADYGTKEAEIFSLIKSPSAPPQIVHNAPNIEKDEPLRRELAHFVDCIRTGKTPRVDGVAGREALALSIAVGEEIRKNLSS